MKRLGKIALGFLLPVLASGCYRSRIADPSEEGALADAPVPAASPPHEYPRADALHPGREECDPGGGCRTVLEDCDGHHAEGPLPTPWWQIDPPAECVTESRHELLEYYDDCAGNGNPTCGGAGVGDAVCGVGVTTLCRTSADCPSGMVCAAAGIEIEMIPAEVAPAMAACEKTCDPTGGPTECVRCDFECSRNGICMKFIRPPSGD